MQLMNVLPIAVNYFYGEPTYMTRSRVCESARQLRNISFVNKEFMSICSEKLGNFKKIDGLIKKYPKNSFHYEISCDQWEEHKGNPPPKFKNWIVDPKGSPELLDALFSGCDFPFADSTFRNYSPEIEEDIKEIVKLNPTSLTSHWGRIYIVDDVTPLYAACVNESIPLHIVDFLLTQGADPKAYVKVNNGPTRIYKLINYLTKDQEKDNPRYSSLLELFKKHGAV